MYKLADTIRPESIAQFAIVPTATPQAEQGDVQEDPGKTAEILESKPDSIIVIESLLTVCRPCPKIEDMMLLDLRQRSAHARHYQPSQGRKNTETILQLRAGDSKEGANHVADTHIGVSRIIGSREFPTEDVSKTRRIFFGETTEQKSFFLDIVENVFDDFRNKPVGKLALYQVLEPSN